MGRDRGVELLTPTAQGAGRGGNKAETCTRESTPTMGYLGEGTAGAHGPEGW